ncbi:hypothetical protein TSUD_222870 [Trifolium subterraneum]|uniref:Uncharacterized protein n=1 Tax=Trifolium subterraneum TaxID=3900 RepID=A0A2Z6N493_TRISU|nr:hypothetical protein TSUD_222870 [Trifolium subterraneum]
MNNTPFSATKYLLIPPKLIRPIQLPLTSSPSMLPEKPKIPAIEHLTLEGGWFRRNCKFKSPVTIYCACYACDSEGNFIQAHTRWKQCDCYRKGRFGLA